MTEVRLIQIVALIVFILMVIALTAIVDRIHEAWKETAPPPPTHVVTWCDTHGHALVLAEENRVYRCGICKLRIVRDPADFAAFDLFDLVGPADHVGSAELGHQGQTGRAA
jgi:hypothetical protein